MTLLTHGWGRIVTPDVDAIKDAFRLAETLDDVNALDFRHADVVKALAASKDRDKRVMAIQIKNLAAYRRIVLTPAKPVEDAGQLSLI